MQQQRYTKDFQQTPVLVSANDAGQCPTLSQFCTKLESAETRVESIRLIKAELARIGVTHFSISQIFKSGDIELTVTTFPTGLRSKITKLALGDHEIAVDYAFAGNSRPLLLSSISSYLDKAIFATRSLQKNRQLKALYGRFGFDDILFLPMIMKGQSGILLFTMGAEDMPANEFQKIMVENNELLVWLAKAAVQTGFPKRSVETVNGDRDKKKDLENSAFELLTIMATRNITLKGAAALMGISSGVANKYMAAAKAILNTSSQSNAIYLAIKQGRIECQSTRPCK